MAKKAVKPVWTYGRYLRRICAVCDTPGTGAVHFLLRVSACRFRARQGCEPMYGST